MSVLVAGPEPVTSRDDLVAALERGAKPKTDWRIGTEHEKFPFHIADNSPVPYDGPHGIRAMLEGLTRFGWLPVREGETLIGLESAKGGGNISLEPGGQFELSGAALETLHQTCAELHDHLAQVKEVGAEHGLGFLGLGFTPNWWRDQIPVMPKGRYKIMTEYMKKVGTMGLDMMYRSCTVQVNLDFASEPDMVKKLRVAVALQPAATAIFANSPFTEGKPNGYLSYRSHVWTDTDRARTGMIPFIFESGFGFEQYVDYALDVPMYFVYRDGRYVDVTGQSFRDFMVGKLRGLEGETPTRGDWINHLTTIFPEARLKNYMEMRGADGGPWARICALPAFWVGLLYDQVSLDAAWDLVKDWTDEERQKLRDDVPRMGLKTPFRNGTLLDVARRAVEISRAGLVARGKGDGAGSTDETTFLSAVEEVVETGKSPADVMLEAYHGRWGGSVDPVFKDYAF
ncbi:MAG: glutamate--cysteine ligase [Parvibaculum sp.]|uniref:glutamate--cysteine ligase n=1 Tax=Parvibaculum sp. TaxID=2024848 RepID=UPI0025F4E0C1|nr:glutamate--cysteine ligase [Parvibaculum sp.]MCE9648692.1 glutamate--cysteine ligase [Parvibaculum sp.]